MKPPILFNMEIWKDIPEWEWKYQISNLWRVKSIFRYYKYLKPSIKRGYATVRLGKSNQKSFLIHRLVASVFMWNSLQFNWTNLVCHKNDIRTDNRVENLFLWTYSDNIQDMLIKNRWVDNRWENNWMSKYTKKQILEVKKLIKEWFWNTKIEKFTWVNNKLVSDVRHWKKWGWLSEENG